MKEKRVAAETDARDRQSRPTHESEISALAGSESDDTPMTGEEDPLAEVSADASPEVAAEFMRSERDAKKANR